MKNEKRAIEASSELEVDKKKQNLVDCKDQWLRKEVSSVKRLIEKCRVISEELKKRGRRGKKLGGNGRE